MKAMICFVGIVDSNDALIQGVRGAGGGWTQDVVVGHRQERCASRMSDGRQGAERTNLRTCSDTRTVFA